MKMQCALCTAFTLKPVGWSLQVTVTHYRIWIGFVSPIPDPQKMPVSEPIPTLSIGSMHPYKNCFENCPKIAALFWNK